MLETKTGKPLSIKALMPSEVISEISQINNQLGALINKLGCETCSFYKASYTFGSKIIEKGKCYLELTDGGKIAFDDDDLPDQLRKDLNYNETENPLGMLLNHAAEFYLSAYGRIKPCIILRKGQIFGIPKAITSIANASTATSALTYNLNAGARSLFILSKITNRRSHAQLQKYCGTPLSEPFLPQEHYHIFVDLAKRMKSTWSFEVLYFPRSWINRLKSAEWAKLSQFLLQMHRESHYSILHNMSTIWENNFHGIEQEKGLFNYAPQSLETAKHLFFLAASGAIGFEPLTDNELAPIDLIKDAYANGYNKIAQIKYAPIVMGPAKFNLEKAMPIYFSLNYATFMQNNQRSQLASLEEVKRIVDSYSKAILFDNIDVDSSLYTIAKLTKFNYYHSEPQNHTSIINANTLSKEDSRFLFNSKGEFPFHSPFFKGCIKISQVSTDS